MSRTKTKIPSHESQLVSLKRIEGQVRGIQKMISEGRYCVDILIQLNSIVGAVQRVQDNVFTSHLNGCFAQALAGKSANDRDAKIAEVMKLIKQFRKV